MSAVKPDPLAKTPYRALRKIGEGGMGVVWEAEHRKLGAVVAVKLLSGRLGKGASDRLRVEAQAQAQVESRHIVRVTHLDETAEGIPYYVMERLRGRSLEEELKARGKLPPAEVRDIILHVLAGLEAAHEKRLLHRDIKLANLFYCDPDERGERVVKLLDFGIAKTLEGSAVAPASLPTQAGLVVGTPRYLAPEQARGKAVDERSDLYALGIVFYMLLCGCGPFDRHKAIEALLIAHVKEEPEPPSKHVAELSSELDAIVLKALAKHPGQRFASARAFADALRRIELVTPFGEGPTVPLAAYEALGSSVLGTEPLPDVVHLTEPMGPAPRQAKPFVSPKRTDKMPEVPEAETEKLYAKKPAPLPKPPPKSTPKPVPMATYVVLGIVALLIAAIAVGFLAGCTSPQKATPSLVPDPRTP